MVLQRRDQIARMVHRRTAQRSGPLPARGSDKSSVSIFCCKSPTSFSPGRNLEEKIFAVFLLEKLTEEFGDTEFRLFESWLSRISSWADHDGLVHYLIAPMVAAEAGAVAQSFSLGEVAEPLASAGGLRGADPGDAAEDVFPEIKRLSDLLLSDEDDMVQKGLGWLLRETAKADAKRTVPYLMSIRKQAPRLVLRTACETLPQVPGERFSRGLPDRDCRASLGRTGRAAVPDVLLGGLDVRFAQTPRHC